MINTIVYNQEDIAEIALIEHYHHPEANLQDYYKLFFQAYWGQGHFVGNLEKAGQYLIREISLMDELYTPVLQDISNRKGYYRISISVVVNGLISVQDYLKIFTAKCNTQITWDDWFIQWQSIQAFLININPKLDNDHDLLKCLRALQDKALISHSEYFRLTYKPHYRVMLLTNEDFNEFPMLKEYL